MSAFFGNRTYGPEFGPEKGSGNTWYVWNETGALEALKLHGTEGAAPIQGLSVIFANGSCARVQPGDALWTALAEAAREREVKVFPLKMSGNYVPWTGDPDSLRDFDGIRIECPAAEPVATACPGREAP